MPVSLYPPRNLLRQDRREAQQQFFNGMVWAASALGLSALGLAVYAMVIEPRRVEVVRQEFFLKSLPPAFDGYTLAQVSDFHLTTIMGPAHYENIAQQVNALEADCIVITGDFLDSREHSRIDMIPPSIRDLRARDGVYAILGNHDYKFNVRAVIQAVGSVGVRMLVNEHTELKCQRGDSSETLYLAGVDDIIRKRQDLDAALNGIREGSCVVLLAHEPDYADDVARDGRVALQLSGHTHGGQLRVPFAGEIRSVLPKLAKRYIMGRYQIGDLQLYVNRGLGLAALPIRFNCLPEITLITLRCGA
jgi:uncharacterized protein